MKKGFTLLETLIALIVIGTISIIYLKYEVQSVTRNNMIKLASFIQSIDKAFYSADALANYPVMPIQQCGNNYCLVATSNNLGFIENLINTKTWTNNIPNLPSNFPENFLDPSTNFYSILDNYTFTIYAYPIGNNEYNIDEIEIQKDNGQGFSYEEEAILYSYLNHRICVDSNGNIHYFMDNTVLNNSLSNLSCPSQVNANYYTIQS